MQKRTEKIKEIARRLLGEKKVDLVIGHRKGSIVLKNAPYFAYTPQEADRLIWDGNCRNNPANFLIPYKDKRVAIVAQGCVSRNVVGLISENQVKRENLYIIGVPCLGMLSPEKVAAASPGNITEIKEDNEKVVITTNGSSVTQAREALIRDNCTQCTHRNPVLYDELVAETVKEQDIPDRYSYLSEVEKLSPEERAGYIDNVFKNCIRCYACRDACPICYCPECFVDKFSPQWCGKSIDSTDVLSYHLIRAFHTAGRCTECGACEDACPMGIKVRMITSKPEKDVKENYEGYEAWLSLEAKPPLLTFKLDDPQPFIK